MIWKYIVENVEYDDTLRNHTWIDGLKTGKTVCQGYAELCLVMCRMAGIQCMYVEGRIETGLHAWNCVNIDGQEYYVDITNDDFNNGNFWLMESCDWEINYSTQNLDMSFRVFKEEV